MSLEVRDGAGIQGIEELEADVVVVGSGAGGAVAAFELASAGRDVLILEAGRHFKPSDFTQRELDTIQTVYVDQGGQGPADGSLSILQGRCVGGSTVVNGEVCFRTPEVVLNEWATRYGVPDFTKADLAPVFEEVEKRVNVTVNEKRYLETGTMMSRGMKALNIDVKPVSRNVKGCRGCVYCFFGCAYGCKQSMDQSYLPAAVEASARIVSQAEVTRIKMTGDRATGVVAKTPHGELAVSAKAVVVACGAIQTPLLLIDNHLGGPEVGQHLAVHPVYFVTGLFEEAKPDDAGAMLATYTDVFVEDGFMIETGSGSLAFGATGVPGIGRAHKEQLRDLKYMWGGGAIVRDTGSLGRVRRNRKGAKVIDYKLDAVTQEKVRGALKKMAEIQFAAGAKKVWFTTVPPRILNGPDDIRSLDQIGLGPADITAVSYHPQCSARMGTVTDCNGVVIGTKNVYVMDGSLFPTPVGVNPQISIMTVSTVLSRRLAAALA